MAEAKRADSGKHSSDKPEFKRNRPELDGVPDLSQLVYLDMPNVLHNVQFRYCEMARKQCYTSISSVLIAINPYETLPIYGQDVINEFHSAALKGREVSGRPHPYGVSARAYMRMVQRKCNQSVIVCGESGAGKTETTKLLMRYLAMTAPISADKQSTNTASIEEQIIAASPILEAYGNAKTVMNNNSSRFGKFTKLLYHVPPNSQKGTILGSSLETYLLEKSRVVFQAVNERNYHIFYFLHAGLGVNNTEFGLKSVDKFNYTNQGQCFAPMKDVERYKELQESLTMFRIDTDVQTLLWKITAGVLNLGNVSFLRKGDGFAEIDKKSMKYVEIVSKLWGLNSTQLEKRLTTKSLQAGGSNIIQKIQFDDAISNRDSIAKGIYENIFLWLCKRINAELLVEDEADDDDEAKTNEENGKYFIGILDVFGFENFYFNSLEQFCINYTNEKLQQYFNFHIIQSEQEEYLKESVFWKPLTIPDNEQYIRLVEHPKNGFWTLLDSSCSGPSKNDTVAFMQLLFRKHDKNAVIHKKTKAGSGNWRGVKPKTKSSRRRGGGAKFDGFMINHFADDVTYNVKNFLIKNLESVHSDTNKMIKKSSVSIFKEINGLDGASGRRRRKRTKKSVTAVFFKGIKTLMKNLNQTEPYFVRCINPNKQKSNKVWTESIVEHQLRCGGLLEALRVLKLGYPTRVPYRLLYEQYHSAVTNPLIKNMNPEAFSTSLLIAFDVNEDDYELGLTKIFFKPAKAAILDTIMSKAGQPLTVQQNDKITRYIVKKRCKQMLGTVKAFTTLRKLVRMKRAAKEWQHKGRVASLIGGTVMKHLYIARKQIRARKEREGAMLMQSYFRAMVERKQFTKKRDAIKDAVKMIWSGYNIMKQRKDMCHALDTMIEQRERKMERLRIEKEEKDKVAAAQAAKEKEDTIQAAAAISKEEQLKLLRAKAKKEQMRLKKIADEQKEEDQRLREEINARKREQEECGSIQDTKRKSIEDTKALKKKIIEQNQRNREIQDAVASAFLKAEADARTAGRYKLNPADLTEYDTESESEPGIISESEEEEDEEDIKVLLSRFHEISAMGQLFYRYAGHRSRTKPQDRVVKVSFEADGSAREISWGSGSRHIYFKDIMYIAWGHYTPAFKARKDKLSPKACFSIVAKDGQVLDLEGYNEHMAELWVKGLRRLKGHNDEQSDEMALKNMKNLLDSNKIAKKQKANDRRKINDIMRLQQDLFIMSTHTVFRHLEEERIWNVDNTVKERFRPQAMYQIALKQDVPWRQWQHWVREQITTYLRENDGVFVDPYRRISKVGPDANNNTAQVQQPSFLPPIPPMKGWVPNPPIKHNQPHYPSQPSQPSTNVNPNGAAEEEKCSLM